jgi:hypothetical protein
MKHYSISEVINYIVFTGISDADSNTIKESFKDYFTYVHGEQQRKANSKQEAAQMFINDYNNDFKFEPKAQINTSIRKLKVV